MQATSPLNSKIAINPTELKQGKELGRGGFGIVYKAKYHNEKVAVKALYQFSEENIEGFKRELEVMIDLRHANIVQLRGAIFSNNNYKIVMEYMAKGALSSYLRSAEKISWFIRHRIAKDIGSGIHFLHQQGIVHCDLKTDNILLDKQYRAKLTDFGLSRLKSKNSTFGYNEGGTFAYMAPELIENMQSAKNTKEADAYSYGVVLWELGTRKAPMTGEKGALPIMAIAKQVLYGPEIREPIDPSTPQPIVKLIGDCWKRDSEQRPKMHQAIEWLKQNPVPKESEESDAFEKESLPKKSELEELPPKLQECMPSILNSSIKMLKLNGSNIDDKSVLALSKALTSNTSITVLDLSGNQIGSEGAVALSKVLVFNTSITELWLNDNKIGAEGAAALSKALATSSSIKELFFTGNSIGDEGAAALGQALASNTFISKLNLSNNNIGLKGAAALGQALVSNRSITSLASIIIILGMRGQRL